MSEYIHEIVLQEYIMEKIAELDLTVQYKQQARMKIVSAEINRNGGFWDLNGKLEDGTQIPIEVEWITNNFTAHKHDKSSSYQSFLDQNGILLVLRKSKELPKIQQLSLLDGQSEAQFKKQFMAWFKAKSPDYIDQTLNTFMVGQYKREIPRIILYDLSINARKNYFPGGQLYRKNPDSPPILGFTQSAYEKKFIRDLQPGDICLFVAMSSRRSSFQKFMCQVQENRLPLLQLSAYKIKGKLVEKPSSSLKIDAQYWPDEIKSGVSIYSYICEIEPQPFIHKTDVMFPFIPSLSHNAWESLRSCIQHGEYRELSPLDFTVLISYL